MMNITVNLDMKTWILDLLDAKRCTNLDEKKKKRMEAQILGDLNLICYEVKALAMCFNSIMHVLLHWERWTILHYECLNQPHDYWTQKKKTTSRRSINDNQTRQDLASRDTQNMFILLENAQALSFIDQKMYKWRRGSFFLSIYATQTYRV